MEMTHRSKKYWDEIAIAIDKMIIVKKRYLTEDFLRKIIVLHSIYTEEKVGKKVIEKWGERYRSTIDNSIFDYDPERLSDLAAKLYPELKETVNVISSGWIKKEPINVTQDWIKNVIILYNELDVNPALYGTAENLPE